MAQFHPFPGLPKELRDQIWDMVIRDDNPGVHYFTIYSTNKDPESVVDPAKKVHAIRSSDAHYDAHYSIGFAAPRCRASGQLSWTDGNISTYLTDSGLWTACFESRERMLRYFKPLKTSPQASPQHKPLHKHVIWDICNKPTASVNMEFIRDNGEHQTLTIQPSADLIILQLPENSNISWDDSRHWEGIQHFPSFRWHTTGNPGNEGHWISSVINNVAVEYNPAWAVYNELGFWSCNDATFGFDYVNDLHGLEAFWIIDYSLKRKFKAEYAHSRRQTFRAGRLTFIEVNSGDEEWCCCSKEDPHPLECCDRGDTKFSAHALADALRRYIELEDNEEWGFDRSHSYAGADVGVLACVNLKLEGDLPTWGEWYGFPK
ncbi:hypothetical protein KVR01_012091 [Diaporthe batatas]|uniref:uncharacterized protein n=1 Tax=Diaporthe batatas TaxID=748121 RepID=UPI001D043CD8|nr:uncharacterized protein KVR01_012091 [Diaporthe batatas]KAG8158330.1 hypothetical protein KVR01_012091 [Diaporthe batatas]